MRHTSKITRILSQVTAASMLLLVMASCKKDKSVDTGTTPPPAAAVLSEYRNDDEFAKFEYNADGTVKKATLKSELNTNGAIVDYNVTYNANKSIKELVTSSGSKIVPVYAGNVLERADIFDGADRSGYTNYLYEGGNLKRATIYLFTDDDFTPMLEFNFTYNAAGNVTETVIMMANGEPNKLVRAGHVTQQYDGKPNPLFAHKELMALLWHASSKNNPTVEEQYDADLQLEDKTTYTYNYKANGYPEAAQVKSGLPGGPQTTTNVQYIYR